MLTVTKRTMYADGPDRTLIVEPGTECRRLTPRELAAIQSDRSIARLRRPGLVWVHLAGQARRIDQRALSDWRPIRGSYGGRGWRHHG